VLVTIDATVVAFVFLCIMSTVNRLRLELLPLDLAHEESTNTTQRVAKTIRVFHFPTVSIAARSR
jgi:hypothetical protein